MTEDELVEKFVGHFERWFTIHREVYDENKIGRIDLILQDKETDAVFGVECKTPGKKRGNDVGEVIQQAIQYSRLTFFGKKIPIFLVPSISHNQLSAPMERVMIEGIEWIRDKHHPEHRHHTVNGLLGNFNIGEVRRIPRTIKPFYDFVFSNKVIFTTKPAWGSERVQGLHKENYIELITKINQWEQTSRIFRTTP